MPQPCTSSAVAADGTSLGALSPMRPVKNQIKPVDPMITAPALTDPEK